MVNKQYNVHNPKLHKSKSSGSPPPVRNFPEVSNLPNPSNGSSLENNLNHVAERQHHHHHHHNHQHQLQNNLDLAAAGGGGAGGRRRHGTVSPPSDEDFGEDGVYGRNISYYSEAAQLGVGESGGGGSNERLNVKDLADISDIGRFQYILQMDREVGTPYSGYTSSSSPTQNCPNSPSAPNSLPSHLHTSRQSYNFWKSSGSQSPLTSASSINSFFRPSSQKRGCFRRTLHVIWRFLKWPLGLLMICSLLGLVVYFLVVDRDIMSSSLLGDSDVYNVEENLSIDFNDFTHTNDLLDGGGGTGGPATTFGRDHKDNAISFSKDGGSPNSKFSFGMNNDLLAVFVKKAEQNRHNELGQGSTFWTSTEHESLSEETPATVVKVSSSSSTTLAPIRKTSTISLKDYTKGRVQFDDDEVFELADVNEHTTRAIDAAVAAPGDIQRNLTSSSSTTTTTTDSSLYRTKVSPTLPILSRFEITTEGLKRFNISEEGTAHKPTRQPKSQR